MMDRAVLITGCSTGIGRATALRLVAGGRWTVYASARRIESIRDLEDAGCRTLVLDVTDESSMIAATTEIERDHGAVAGLVNNAGYGLEGAFESTSMNEIRRQFETNVFGLVRLSQLVLPGMRRQQFGRIINVSSVGGKIVFPGGSFYHATKHAVEALSDALRFEVAGFGIDVVVVEPGLIKTSFGETSQASVASDDGPYAAFNAAVAERVVRAYEGPMGFLAAGPSAVARVIDRALSARRPRSRYRVTTGARVILTMRKLMPDGAWDLMMRAQFPRP